MTAPTPSRSSLGVRIRSPLGVWAAIQEHSMPGTSNVLMTWSVEFVKFDVAAQTKDATVSGLVTLHQRYYHNTLWLMGAASGRGVCRVLHLVTAGFSGGVIDPINDEHDSNGLNLQPLFGVGTYQNTGWFDLSGDGGKPPFVDTGSTIEVYGHVSLTLSGGAPPGTHNFDGVYARRPNVMQGVLSTVNWILMYFSGAGMSLTQGDGKAIEVRSKVVITV